MPEYKFFLSYAHNDKSPYMDDFYYSLRQFVMIKTGIKQSDLIAFRDTDDVDFGAKWTPELEQALQNSSVIVCTYSPSYFASEYCGKEVAIFQSRISEYAKIHKRDAPVILPILWETPSIFQIPECLNEVQYLHAEIHEDYAKKGLLTFSKLTKYHDPYIEFIDFLATNIVNIANQYKLPKAVIHSINDIASAFI